MGRITTTLYKSNWFGQILFFISMNGLYSKNCSHEDQTMYHLISTTTEIELTGNLKKKCTTWNTQFSDKKTVELQRILIQIESNASIVGAKQRTLMTGEGVKELTRKRQLNKSY